MDQHGIYSQYHRVTRLGSHHCQLEYSGWWCWGVLKIDGCFFFYFNEDWFYWKTKILEKRVKKIKQINLIMWITQHFSSFSEWIILWIIDLTHDLFLGSIQYKDHHSNWRLQHASVFPTLRRWTFVCSATFDSFKSENFHSKAYY